MNLVHSIFQVHLLAGGNRVQERDHTQYSFGLVSVVSGDRNRNY